MLCIKVNLNLLDSNVSVHMAGDKPEASRFTGSYRPFPGNFSIIGDKVAEEVRIDV